MPVKLKKFSKEKLAENAPFPAPNANKYTRGKLVAIGGSKAYPGAICLATDAAYRAGAGYVEAICSPEAVNVLHAYNPNVVVKSWNEWSIADTKLTELDWNHPHACLIGSGFDDSDDKQRQLVFDVLKSCEYPVVIDGGAITYLASEEGRALSSRRADRHALTVVTPHFGEAERLGAPLRMHAPVDPGDDPEDDARFAQHLADAYGATIVLKGENTYIASAQIPLHGTDDVVYLMNKGTAALAKAGTGDVLAGTIAALCAQGIEPVIAANLGANAHAIAGKLASEKFSDIGVCASDLPAYIAKALAKMR